MTEVTGRDQGSASKLSEAERRRRLASVYRLLVQLGQRENSGAEKCEVEQDRTGTPSGDKCMTPESE